MQSTELNESDSAISEDSTAEATSSKVQDSASPMPETGSYKTKNFAASTTRSPTLRSDLVFNPNQKGS
jgi:hypothetical protein